MKTIISFMLIIFLNLTLAQTIEGKYEINGYLKNIPNKSVAFLYCDGKIIDSCIVDQGKIMFKGRVDHPSHAYLQIDKREVSSDITDFWIENVEILIKAEKGNFEHAKITGSQVQKDYDILKQRTSVIDEEQHKYSKLLMQIMNDQEKNGGQLDVDEKKLKEINEELTKGHDLENKRHDIIINYIKEFPNSIVSSWLLSFYSITWSKEKTSDLYNKLTISNQNSYYGKQISMYLEKNKEFKIGDDCVDFEMNNLKGESVKLSNYKGKFVLLEFWSSGCKPCRSENPNLLNLYKKYNSKGFEILGVSLDTEKDKWSAAIAKDGLIWEQVSDLKEMNEAEILYGVSYIPQNFLIDNNGKIISKDLRGEMLNNKLKELFEK